MSSVAGKRAGSRRGAKPKASFNRPALVFAVAITVCLIAWGYLVYLAIDFGATARAGESTAWGLLALSSLGAVACLFAGLLFVSRLLRALGIIPDRDSTADGPAPPTPAPTSSPQPIDIPPPAATRAPGGRRAAR